MKRNSLLLGVCAILICTLAACSLAREEASDNPREDKLIGVFITTEYIDLFDFDRYLNENLSGFQGGAIVMDGNNEKYQGRLYASLVPRTLTNEETGETSEILEYKFEGIEGIPYFSPTAQDEHGNYTASASDDAISEGHMSIKQGDDENSVSMEGTLYVVPASMNAYYPNPVYQSADGSVYLVSGSGISASGVHDDGPMMSQTLSADYTVTENGKTKTDSFSVTISVSVMSAPEKIIILQMNADSELLSRHEYVPGTLPESFVPDDKTAFMIVETQKRNFEGKLKVTRNIYGNSDESIETFSARADGVCVKSWTRIAWPDSQISNLQKNIHVL